jgi:hypothetical protein
VAAAGVVGPGEGDDDTVAVLLNVVEPVIVVSGTCTAGDRSENLTGLVRAASGWRRAPETDQAAPAAPLHRGVDQRDERLDVAPAKGVKSTADGIDAHRRQATAGLRAKQSSKRSARRDKLYVRL